MRPQKLLPRLWFGCLAAAVGSASATALESWGPQLQGFISEMSERYGFDAEALEALFGQVEHRPDVIEAISRPAEKTKPWHEYRGIFLTDERIAGGMQFWQEHADAIAAISAESGIPGRVLVAIIGVETYYGRRTGAYRVIDALSTLAFNYPPRSAFFRSELEQFLLLSREEQVEPLSVTGSYAGAMGLPQFMPSSYRRYAVDSSRDGRRDLWTDPIDVLGSVANYLAVHGWRRDEPIAVEARYEESMAGLAGDGLRLDTTVEALRRAGLAFETDQPEVAEATLLLLESAGGPELWVGFRNFHVITRYNRSRMYAMAVHQLGEQIGERRCDAERR